MSRRIVLLALLLLALAAVVQPSTAQERDIDLFFPSVEGDPWSFSEESNVIIFELRVANNGRHPSPPTIVRVVAWNEVYDFEVPELVPGQPQILNIEIGIPDHIQGTTQRFTFTLDPDALTSETKEKRGDNQLTLGPIQLPSPSQPELIIEDYHPRSGEQGTTIQVEFVGQGFQPETLIKIADVDIISIELVEPNLILAKFDLTHTSPGDKSITLFNPDGTRAQIPKDLSFFQVSPAVPAPTATRPPSTPSPTPTPTPSTPSFSPRDLLVGIVLGIISLGVIQIIVRFLNPSIRITINPKIFNKTSSPDQECQFGNLGLIDPEMELTLKPWQIAEIQVHLMTDAGESQVHMGAEPKDIERLNYVIQNSDRPSTFPPLKPTSLANTVARYLLYYEKTSSLSLATTLIGSTVSVTTAITVCVGKFSLESPKITRTAHDKKHFTQRLPLSLSSLEVENQQTITAQLEAAFLALVNMVTNMNT